MDAVRRYVFPIIWMVILAVIAASLAKMAFFTDAAEGAEDQNSPTASLGATSTVPVTKEDIASTLSLKGTVKPDAGKSVTATTAGEINKVWVSNGDTIGRGAPILQVKVPKDVEAAPAPAAPSSPGAPAPAPAPAAPAQQFTYHTLYSSGAGTVRDLKALNGQSLTVGDVVATLSPGTYAVVADLTPEQQLSLLDKPLKARAKMPAGGAPITCDTTKIEEDTAEESEKEQPAAPAGIDPNTGMPAESTASVASLRCAIPESAKIVPGLSVDVTVDLGSAKGVLTVPTTAVTGTVGEGTVYLSDPEGGATKEQKVALGLRSEDRVQITSGLKEGQEVMQFAPGVDNPEMGQGW